MKKLVTTLFLSILYILCNAQTGAIDPTFDPGSGANNTIWSTRIQTDGKIIIGGDYTSYNGTARNRIARLNTDGSLDLSFNPGTGADARVSTISIQSDGKIIIGGHFTNYNGTARNRIARLNTDGSLDVSFDPGTGVNGQLTTVSIQSDGKIIIGGTFTSFNGTARNRIARLNADGSLDVSFNPGTGASSYIHSTSIQIDGKIIIGGNFAAYNGTLRNRIARINSDGSLDVSFNPGTGTNSGSNVFTSYIQTDGKIIIGGEFISYNGTAINNIARLNDNGSLDASFMVGTGADSYVYGISIQSDDKIIIVGEFVNYNGTPRSHIARLNADGSLDASFNPGTGTDNFIFSNSIQSDGKIIIGGAFTTYNGVGRNSVARIIGPSISLPLQLIKFSGNYENEKVKLNWETEMEENVKGFTILKSTDALNYSKIYWVNASNVQGVNNYSYVDPTLANAQVFYKLEIEDEDGGKSHSKILKFINKNYTSLKVFPNPCKEMLTVSATQKQNAYIFNSQGQLIKFIDVDEGVNKIDLNGIPKGNYYLKTTQENGVQFIKN